MTTEALFLELPWPPSVNNYWRNIVMGKSARTLLSKKGREYRKQASQACLVQGVSLKALSDRLSVTIVAQPPDRRRRDLDNLPKGILDALTHAEVWKDDSQIDELSIIRAPVTKGGRVHITIKQLEINNDSTTNKSNNSD